MPESLILSEQDIALPEDNKAPSRLEGVIQSIKRFATFSEILRIFGAGIMVASVSVFLLQGWNDGNDIHRYLKLLAQTGLLAAGGFSLIYLLADRKGARLFFALALISIPANFAILGALLYSRFSWIAPQTTYPGFAMWDLPDAVSIGLVVCGAMVVIISVSLLGFRILARRSAKFLVPAFLGINAFLLVPVRDSLSVAIMLGLSILIPAWLIKKCSAQDTTLDTFEGKFALAILFVCPALLLGRNLYLYQVDSLLCLIFSGCSFYIFRQLYLSKASGSMMCKLYEVLSVAMAYGTAYWGADLIDSLSGGHAMEIVFCAILGVFVVDFAMRASDSRMNQNIIIATALTITLTLVNYLIAADTAVSAIICTAAGLSLVYFGMLFKDWLVTLIGWFEVAFAVLFGLEDVIVFVFSSTWIGLALVGGFSIIFAALLDRYGPLIKLSISKWAKSVAISKSENTRGGASLV